ncbi:unnamed protein product [Cuscuta epithymum]|uniref:Uncharacterized protein n=1 Tax=Cuscuta epithymum TaxID=186058 RepID=A0AAV0DXS0_9ASTE|nr:unnamed protein product [Cuscuta epithymum]
MNTVMEDKRLNLNQPFLSVRRTDRPTDTSTPPRPPPPYKSKLNSGPLRDPGVVPFCWEHSPGRPKHETHHTSAASADKASPPIIPKLPPGRTSKADQQQRLNSKGSEMENISQHESLRKKMVKPISFSSSNGSIEDEEEKEEERVESSSDEDETYVDALDTISSKPESALLNHSSASGFSGLNEPNGTFTADLQTRDFMIDRFLPAAISMATEMPSHAPRKQSIVLEQPRNHPVNTVNADKQRPQLRYGPSFARHYYQSHDYAEVINDNDDEDGDDNDGSFPPKVCGLIPRFCLKGSFFLMNPLPGMSARTQVPMSPSSSRMQIESSSAGSCSGTENERSASDVSERQPVIGLLTAESHEDNNKSDDEFKKRTTQNINDKNLGGRHFIGLDKRKCKKSVESLTDKSNSVAPEDSDSCAIVEKTLYVVDTLQETRGPQFIKEDHEVMKPKGKQNKMEAFPFIEEASTDEVTNIKHIVHETADLKPLLSADKLNSESRRRPSKAYGKDQFFTNTSVMPNSRADESYIEGTERLKKSVEFPVPPPLPMSPSESWLCRTLPSLSTKRSSLQRTYLIGNGNPRNVAPKVTSGDSKWETMVKTTKGHHQHLRYSLELMALPPIPETQQ